MMRACTPTRTGCFLFSQLICGSTAQCARQSGRNGSIGMSTEIHRFIDAVATHNQRKAHLKFNLKVGMKFMLVSKCERLKNNFTCAHVNASASAQTHARARSKTLIGNSGFFFLSFLTSYSYTENIVGHYCYKLCLNEKKKRKNQI